MFATDTYSNSTVTNPCRIQQQGGSLCQILRRSPLLFCILAPFFHSAAIAQILPDSTLGTESSIVVPDIIDDFESERIDGGAVRGNNLFHSFQEFNIPEGGAAYFSNPASIENILTRVTGGNPSNIFGVLGVLGNANLFFFNPNGIVFGENARLDVGGSFLGSTADGLQFENGFTFSASNPTAPPLLTVNLPVGISFREAPGAIAVNGAELSLPTEASLTLLGGTVTLQGARLFVPGGSITLGSVAGTGAIASDEAGNLAFPEGLVRGNVLVGGTSRVSVLAEGGGGGITVTAGNIELTDSTLDAGILANPEITETFPGTIFLDGTGNITVQSSSLLSSPLGAGNGGAIFIRTDGAVTIADSFITSDASNEDANTGGAAGLIEITSGNTLSIANSRLATDGFGEQTGDRVGEIFLQAGAIALSENSILSATADGGTAGDITLRGDATVAIADSTITSDASNTLMNLESSAGFIDIAAGGTLDIARSFLTTESLGTGVLSDSTAGNLSLTARAIAVSDSQLTSSAQGGGGAGSISITANETATVNASTLSSSATNNDGSSGVAGSILVTATNGVAIAGSTIISVSGNNNRDAGVSRIELQAAAGSLSLDNTTVDSTNIGTAFAGDIIVNARDEIVLRNNTEVLSNGDRGRIFIGGSDRVDSTLVPSIVTVTASRVATDYAGAAAVADGRAGDIALQASDRLSIADSSITSDAVGAGAAGNLTLLAGEALAIANSRITTESESDDTSGEFSVLRLSASTGAITLTQTNISATNIGAAFAGDIFLAALTDINLTESLITSDGNRGRIFVGRETLQAPLDSDLVPRRLLLDNVALTTNNAASQADDSQTISSGDVLLFAREQIAITNDSRLESLTSRTGDAGSIILRVDAGEAIISDSRLLSDSLATAEGEGGNINIEAGTLQVTDGSILSARTASQFPGGNIFLTGDTTTVSGSSQILTTSLGIGQAGAIFVEMTGGVNLVGNPAVQDLIVLLDGILSEIGLDDAQRQATLTSIQAETDLEVLLGTTLNVEEIATEAIASLQTVGLTETQAQTVFDLLTERLEPQTGLLAQATNPEGRGSGDISINASSLTVTDEAVLETSTSGIGSAGSIRLTVEDAVVFDRGVAASRVEPGGRGDGGSIELEARTFSLRDSRLDAGTLGEGDAGNISLTLTGALSLSNSGIFSDAATPDATVNGGTINITAASLTMTDGSFLETSTAGAGRAGDITLNIDGDVAIAQDSRIVSNSTSTGDAGDITLTARLLELEDGSTIEAATTSGNGGDISLQVTERVQLRDLSRISTSAGTSGAGGDGGNIVVGTRFLLGSGNSDITSNAFQGAGGFIQLNAEDGIFGLQFRDRLTPQNDITAFSQTNPQLSGEVEINSPEVDPSGLVDFPEVVVDPAALIARNLCDIGRESAFVITGRGGLPTSPGDPLGGDRLQIDLVAPAEISPNPSQLPQEGTTVPFPTNSSDTITPARGWVRGDRGEVILTSYNVPGSNPEKASERLQWFQSFCSESGD